SALLHPLFAASLEILENVRTIVLDRAPWEQAQKLWNLAHVAPTFDLVSAFVVYRHAAPHIDDGPGWKRSVTGREFRPGCWIVHDWLLAVLCQVLVDVPQSQSPDDLGDADRIGLAFRFFVSDPHKGGVHLFMLRIGDFPFDFTGLICHISPYCPAVTF